MAIDHKKPKVLIFLRCVYGQSYPLGLGWFKNLFNEYTPTFGLSLCIIPTELNYTPVERNQLDKMHRKVNFVHADVSYGSKLH